MSAHVNAQTGVAYARTEDHRLITGQGQYTADVHYPGTLHLHVIRSMHAHARIVRMDLSAVAAAPGVRWVMSADDIDQHGGQDLPNAVSVKDRHGEAQRVARMPVLARDRVRFVGQPIAFVIADSAYQAQDAAELADEVRVHMGQKTFEHDFRHCGEMSRAILRRDLAVQTMDADAEPLIIRPAARHVQHGLE